MEWLIPIIICVLVGVILLVVEMYVPGFALPLMVWLTTTSTRRRAFCLVLPTIMLHSLTWVQV